MALALEADTYHPSLDSQQNYADSLPASSKFENGLRCGCGTRKDHVYDSRAKFSIHIKSQRHQAWIQELNANKNNHMSQNAQLAETVTNQKMIIAHQQRQIDDLSARVEALTKRLDEQSAAAKGQIDLLVFD